jgi:hypothetical protein
MMLDRFGIIDIVIVRPGVFMGKEVKDTCHDV